MSDKLITLSEEQVTRYLQLTDRRMFIIMHSGASWKPEYAQELEEIDREIAVLRTAIDAAVTARHLAQGQEPETVSDNIATDCKHSDESPLARSQKQYQEMLYPAMQIPGVPRPGMDALSPPGQAGKPRSLILDIVSFFTLFPYGADSKGALRCATVTCMTMTLPQ